MQVTKRDGSTEEFNLQKITNVLLAAQLDYVQAKSISASIKKWADAFGDKPIPTIEIRNQVVSLLNSANPNVANLYVWFEKSKT